MQIEIFSSLQDLEPIFAGGVGVICRHLITAAGYLLDREQAQGYFETDPPPAFTIEISTNEQRFYDCLPLLGGDSAVRFLRGANVLTHQKVTFVHELIHLFRQYHGFEPKERNLFAMPAGTKSVTLIEYESLVDAAAVRIVRKQHELLETMLASLTSRANCPFRYFEDTPFMYFERQIRFGTISCPFANATQLPLFEGDV